MGFCHGRDVCGGSGDYIMLGCTIKSEIEGLYSSRDTTFVCVSDCGASRRKFGISGLYETTPIRIESLWHQSGLMGCFIRLQSSRAGLPSGRDAHRG